MFEKEADKIAKDIYMHHFDDDVNYPDVLQAITVGVQKGAELGYNKANEWHYVKDGDLPTENQLVLLYRENPNGANVALTYWYKSYVNDKVIAWKEIVLPELKKFQSLERSSYDLP